MRVTVTLTEEQRRVLQAMADKHKVSLSWLIRHAIDRMIQGGEGEMQLSLPLPR